MKYHNNLEVAKKLAQNKYANQEYYEKMSNKFEKLLRFYKNLKIWEGISNK